MRPISKTTAAAASALALIAGTGAATAGNYWYNQSSHVQQVSTRSHFRNGVYRGPAVRQYYGYVQAQAHIRNGRISSIDILRYPTDYSTSRWINSRALPVLKSEVIRAQSTRVSGVSGATLTTEAFLMSVRGALHKAGG